MKRVVVLGAVLLAAALHPGPAAQADPAPPSVAASPLDRVARPAPNLSSFDGRYMGRMTVDVSDVAFSTVTYPYCADERINMTIHNGYATVSYQDWKNHTLHYRGQIDPAGTINMSHLNGDGSSSDFTLNITETGAKGQMQRGDCWYDVSMTRA